MQNSIVESLMDLTVMFPVILETLLSKCSKSLRIIKARPGIFDSFVVLLIGCGYKYKVHGN